MLAVTPTKLSDYLACPLKYKLRHVDKSGGADYSAALSFGQSIHSALQELYQSNKNLNDFEDVSKILARHWNRGTYADTEENEAYFLKGSQALRNYCKIFGSSLEITIGTEVYMSYILKINDLQARLGCKADRICVQSGEVLEIIDYKTNNSGKVATMESLENNLPTFLYYALARITYPEYKRIRISFLNVLTLAKVSVEYSPAQVAANKQNLFDCLKNIADGAFTPKPSEACSWCSFQDRCGAFNKVVDFASIT